MLLYLSIRPKVHYSHSSNHPFTHGQQLRSRTLAPTCKHQEQCGVRFLAQGSAVDRSTSAQQLPVWPVKKKTCQEACLYFLDLFTVRQERKPLFHHRALPSTPWQKTAPTAAFNAQTEQEMSVIFHVLII